MENMKMKKEIKDYLHLYLGCKVVIEKIENEHSTLTVKRGFYGKVGDVLTLDRFHIGMIRHEDGGVYTFKPILRTIDSMTEEECIKIFLLPIEKENYTIKTGEEFRKMLALGIDVFGLIEAGLAIDKTEVEKAKTDQV